MAKTVFYSFHYTRDVHRVQLIKNVNALEGQPILNSQQWEKVQRGGTPAIQKWIDGQMAYKRAVVVLIGKETAARPWVKYEIEKSWSIGSHWWVSGFMACHPWGPLTASAGTPSPTQVYQACPSTIQPSRLARQHRLAGYLSRPRRQNRAMGLTGCDTTMTSDPCPFCTIISGEDPNRACCTETRTSRPSSR